MAGQLKRNIGTVQALFYGLGVIIGAGIYVLVAPASGLAGNAVWLSFAIAATLATFTGLGYAELASMFPKAAAEYVYIKRAYKSHLYAFMLGWSIVFTTIVTISTVSLGFTGYVSDLLGVTKEEASHIVPIISMALIGSMAAVNLVGIRETSWANFGMTSLVIVGLLIVISLAAFSGSIGTVDYFEMPFGFEGVFMAASLIFFAYLGFEEIVNVAEETRRPTRVIPKAIILAVVISTALYMATSISLISLVGWESLSQTTAPLANVVGQYMGHQAELVVSGIALFATSSTVLGMILVVSRMLWGMSREGALPKFLSHINRRGVPVYAVVIVSAASAVFVLVGDIGKIASITSAGALIIFLNVNAALIWLRYKQPNLVRPFRTPLNIGKFPVIAALGVAISVFMLSRFDAYTLAIGGVITAVGGAVFLVYKRRDYGFYRQIRGLFGDIKREAER